MAHPACPVERAATRVYGLLTVGNTFFFPILWALPHAWWMPILPAEECLIFACRDEASRTHMVVRTEDGFYELIQ